MTAMVANGEQQELRQNQQQKALDALLTME